MAAQPCTNLKNIESYTKWGEMYGMWVSFNQAIERRDGIVTLKTISLLF